MNVTIFTLPQCSRFLLNNINKASNISCAFYYFTPFSSEIITSTGSINRLLVNSFKSSIFTNRTMKRKLNKLSGSFEIRYLRDLHSKLFICDQFAFTGSPNFSPRAFFKNHETVVFSYDPFFISTLLSIFNTLWERSKPLK